MAEMTYLDDIRGVATADLPWSKLDGCNILITGATGLIGSCLIEVLMAHPNKTYKIFAMGRSEQRLKQLSEKYEKDDSFIPLKWDILRPLDYSFPFHYIVHAASGATPGEFVAHPVEVMKANFTGLINLMDYGLTHNMRRMLYVSSGEVYGEGDGRMFTEDYSGYVNPMTSRACYPSSKRAAETLCSSYISEYNADIVVARPCHVYGPHFTENDNRVYAQFIRNILDDEDIVMKSNGEQYRSWCYVADCVSGLLHILLKGKKGEAYNIADESSSLTIHQLATLIAGYNNRSVIMQLASGVERNRENPVRKSVFSTNKLSSLGWRVSGDMRDKMFKTINECRNYANER